MTAFLLIMVLFLVGTNVFMVNRFVKVRQELEELKAVPPAAIEAPDHKGLNPKHDLEMTFTDRRITTDVNNGQDFHGWHFICKCGTIAPATDNDTQFEYKHPGTEAGAVKAWRAHHDLYEELVHSEESEVERLRKELKAQKDSCICHDLV